MLKGRKRAKRKDNLGVNDFRHEEATRKNNPPAGLAPTYEVRKRKTTQHQYDPHLSPQLVWSGKEKHTSFMVKGGLSPRPLFVDLKASKQMHNMVCFLPAARPASAGGGEGDEFSDEGGGRGLVGLEVKPWL